MKKIIAVVLAMMLMSGVCYATQTQRTIMDEESLTRLNTAEEADIYVGDAKRVSFFVVNDSSLTTEGATCSVTVAVSIDGDKWQDINWYDILGTTTKQTSENLGNYNGNGIGDGVYYGWFDTNMTMPMLRFRVTMDSTAATQIGSAAYNNVTITVIEDK